MRLFTLVLVCMSLPAVAVEYDYTKAQPRTEINRKAYAAFLKDPVPPFLYPRKPLITLVKNEDEHVILVPGTWTDSGDAGVHSRGFVMCTFHFAAETDVEMNTCVWGPMGCETSTVDVRGFDEFDDDTAKHLEMARQILCKSKH